MGFPSAASALARVAAVVTTTVAFHVCMAKPNPPPKDDECKEVSRLENASKALLRPLAVFFSLAPAIVETVVVLARLAIHDDLVSGTCAERISFDGFALVGCVTSLCGMGIRWWCYQELGVLFTFELAILPGHRLITTGPYAVIRHPSYTGGMLGMAGMTIVNVCVGSWAYECGTAFSWWGIGWGTIVLISTIVLVERCPREDQLLRDEFAGEWDQWRKRVRWRMIPWAY